MEILALALVFVVHVIGGLLLVWALLDDEARCGWRRRWGRGGDEPQGRPQGPPPGDVVRRPLPLPHAAASPVRLREHGRVADSYPRPARRPAHPGEPAPGHPVRR
ncbi:MAG TPA: hypothetical protein VF526_09900 [Solirubrobacteraceae bacterium]|jgi:hypothetical protein